MTRIGLSPDYVTSGLRTVVPPQNGRNSWCASATERKSADLSDILGVGDSEMVDAAQRVENTGCYGNGVPVLGSCMPFGYLECTDHDMVDDDFDAFLHSYGKDIVPEQQNGMVPEQPQAQYNDHGYACPVPVTVATTTEHLSPAPHELHATSPRTPIGLNISTPHIAQLCEPLFPTFPTSADPGLGPGQTVC